MEIKGYIEGRYPMTGTMRGKNMVCSATCYKDKVIIRHDDEKNLDFWLQTHIDRETLLELLKQMDEAVE